MSLLHFRRGVYELVWQFCDMKVATMCVVWGINSDCFSTKKVEEACGLSFIKSVMANGLYRIKVGKNPAKKVDIKTEENN